MSESKAAPKDEHVGTKTIAMLFGIVLAVIYSIMSFFANSPLTMEELWNIGMNTAFYTIAWTAVVFFAQIFWKYFHKLSEKLYTPGTEHVGTKTIAMLFGMLLSVIYAITTFFNTPLATIETLYNIGLVTAFFMIVWSAIVFFAQILWAYAHKLSEKIGT